MTTHSPFGTPDDPFGADAFDDDSERDQFGRLVTAPTNPVPPMRRSWRKGTLLEDGGESMFRLAKPVGDIGRNLQPDTAKVQGVLERAGFMDLKRTEGPTGLYSFLTEESIRAAQKATGLQVDGLIRPGGETIRMLRAKVGPRPKAVHAPPPPPPSVARPGETRAAQAGAPPAASGNSPAAAPPIIPVPKYRSQVLAAQTGVWQRWSLNIGRLPNVSKAEQRAYMETFAAEGGRRRDPHGSASSRITQKTLNGFIDRGKFSGIKRGTPPHLLSMSDRVRFYRAYTNDALSLVPGGAAALGRLNDVEAASALVDTLFRHGRGAGADIIQKAINVVSNSNVAERQPVGNETFKAFAGIVNSNARQRLLDAIAALRTKAMPGEAARFNHFRFLKPTGGSPSP